MAELSKGEFIRRACALRSRDPEVAKAAWAEHVRRFAGVLTEEDLIIERLESTSEVLHG